MSPEKRKIEQVGLRDMRLAGISTQQVKEFSQTYCPHCNYGPMDGLTGTAFSDDPNEKVETVLPEDGSPTLCAKCASLLIFRVKDGSLNIVEPSEEDLKPLQADHQIWNVILKMQAMLKNRKDK